MKKGKKRGREEEGKKRKEKCVRKKRKNSGQRNLGKILRVSWKPKENFNKEIIQ